MATKNTKTYRIIGKPIDGQTVEDVAGKVSALANELRTAKDALHQRQLTNSIMHLAADIAATVSD